MKLSKFALAISASLILAGALNAQPRTAATTRASTSTAAREVGAQYQISAKDLKTRLNKHQKTVIIDARGDIEGQMIKGAVHVPSSKLDDWAKTTDKHAFIVTYCTCPHDEAAEAEVKTLRDMGFTNAYSLTGGLNAAQSNGIAVVPAGE